MRRMLCVAVGIVIDMRDEKSNACACHANSPLDELMARLRHEACHGRDSRMPDVTSPNVTVWMAAAYQECADPI